MELFCCVWVRAIEPEVLAFDDKFEGLCILHRIRGSRMQICKLCT